MASLQIDWLGIFMPGTSLLETIVRGTVTYFVLLAFIRLVPRRTVGSLGIMDLLVAVLIADAAGKGFGDYDTVGDGIILVATLFGWSYFLNWLTYAHPAAERFLSPRPLPVVRTGRLLQRNMRSEFITEDELMRQLRLEGIQDLSEVKMAYVEADGTLSVTKYEQTGGS